MKMNTNKIKLVNLYKLSVIFVFTLVMFMGLSLLPAAPAMAQEGPKTWYVDAVNGDNTLTGLADTWTDTSGDGTKNSGEPGPFKTISKAATTASAGDTIKVAAGTYNEAFTIDKSLTLQGAKAGVDARFRSVDETETVIDPNDKDGGATKSWVIRVRASNVTIDGFTIQNPILVYGSAGLIDITGAWSNLRILNNILQQPGVSTSQSTNWGKFGINVEGALDVLIENNYFRDILCDTATPWNGTCAIWPSGSSNIKIRYNKIENATSFGIGLSNDNNGVTIIGNEITLGIQSATAQPSIQTAGIRIATGNNNIIIKDNLIYDCPGTTVQPAAGITIQNEGTNNITDNQITNNIFGIKIVETATASMITIKDNKIAGNTEYGILNNDTNTLDATRNWWGDESGPKHASNPDGEGDKVSDNVLYYPWYTDATLTTLSNVITLTKTGPASAKPGDVITYTIKCKNEGKFDEFNETNVVITETYPPEVEFVEASPAPTTGNNQWAIGTLDPGAEKTITVTVRIK